MVLYEVVHRPKVCIILGAGASRDVRNEGSPIIQAAWQPPLAKDLFDIANHEEYWEVLRPYPGAASLAQLLAPKVANGAEPIEQELRRLAEHRDPTIRAQFKEVPCYLRDLLASVSTKYTHWPGCYTQLVVEFLAETPHDILFLVLNYDNFLEQALTGYQQKWIFDSMERYVAEQRPKVVKLHGSINWFRPLGPSQVSWNQLVQNLDISERGADGAIRVLDRPDRVLSLGDDGNRWYPVLTAPVAGKNAGAFVCPARHLAVAREFLGSCRKFLIIGTSGLDEDLVTLLKDSLPPNLKPTLQLVGFGQTDADKAIDRFEKGVPAFRGRRITPPGYLHIGGFREYIRSGELSRFAAFDPGKND